ncbi:hypothetical protein AX15_005237, partial [Amanita polypyramis BW_CC]
HSSISELEIFEKRRFQDEEGGPPIHNAVHDMESFLWVLLYIAITRTGTHMRRPELDPGPDSDNELQDIVIDLFENVSKTSRTSSESNDGLCCVNGRLFKAVEHYNVHAIVPNILDEAITFIKGEKDDKSTAELKKKTDEGRTTWNK